MVPSFIPIVLPASHPFAKRPRPTCQASPTNHENQLPSQQYFSKKVQNHIFETEQTSDISQTSPTTPLPVQLDLLTYRARQLTRGPNADPSKAEVLYRRCISINSADGRAWLGLARIQISIGNYEQARRTFRRGVSASRKNPYLLQAWGVFEERQSCIERAKSLYESAIRADDTHCASWVALGLWYQRHARDPLSARDAFKRGALADPSNYYVWHVWGVLEKSLSNYSAARSCFQKGIEANPNNAATFVLWGCLEDRLGHFKEATSLFKHAHKAGPRNTHAYISHAVACERAGDSRKAASLLRRAINVRPDDPAPHQAYAMLAYRAGDMKEARKHILDALRINKRHGPSWHAWARMEERNGNLSRARELFQEAIWAAPQSRHAVRTWHSWANLEASQDNVQQARRYFVHGLDIDPHSIPLLSSLAKLEAEDGNMPRARDLLESCIKLQPNTHTIWKLYSELERTHGSASRAQLVFERSVVMAGRENERLSVSEPLPGDFAPTGMWIDVLELSPTESALSLLEVDSEVNMGRMNVRPFNDNSSRTRSKRNGDRNSFKSDGAKSRNVREEDSVASSQMHSEPSNRKQPDSVDVPKPSSTVPPAVSPLSPEPPSAMPFMAAVLGFFSISLTFL